MNLNNFRNQVGMALERIKLMPVPEPKPTDAYSQTVIAELDTFAEELRVADEELRVQNEQLIATRHEMESERVRYKALFDLAPDAYIVTGAQATIREANLAAGHLLSTEPPNLFGKPLVVFVPENDRRAFRERLDALLGDVGPTRWEMSLIPRVAKRPIPVRVTAQASGVGFSATIRWLFTDLTEVDKLTKTVRNLDEGMWQRVAEHTAYLHEENERLKSQVEDYRREIETLKNSQPH